MSFSAHSYLFSFRYAFNTNSVKTLRTDDQHGLADNPDGSLACESDGQQSDATAAPRVDQSHGGGRAEAAEADQVAPRARHRHAARSAKRALHGTRHLAWHASREERTRE